MISTAFLIFICITILGYGVQGSLQTTYARKYDAFVVTIYRNVSLAFTMLPVLFFVSPEQIFEIWDHIFLLFIASGTGALSLLFALTSSRYLPIGIGTAIRQIVHVSFAILLGVVFLREVLSIAQILILAGIVFAGVALALVRSDHPHLDQRNVWKGLMLTSGGGVIVALTFYFFSQLSREINPLVAGYFWETGVGFFALLYFLFLRTTHKIDTSIAIPVNDAGKIVAIALITIPATVSYAFALTAGSYALASGLITMTTFVAAVMGWLMYNERLTKFQIGLIVVAVTLMFMLKAFS